MLAIAIVYDPETKSFSIGFKLQRFIEGECIAFESIPSFVKAQFRNLDYLCVQ